MKKAFTLLELLIVITILAILAGAMIPLFTTTRRQAQDAKAMADLDAIKSAAVMMKYDIQRWPSPISGDATCLINTAGGGCVTSGWLGPYLTDWGVDPYGTVTAPQYYRILSSGQRTYAQSWGPDNNEDNCQVLCTNTTNDCDLCVLITGDNRK